MRKITFLISALLITQIAFSQLFTYGIKGGINSTKLNFSDVSIGNIDPENSTADVSFTPSSYEVGYHFGLFAKVKLMALYVQPELIFSQTKSSINVVDTDPESVLNSTALIKYNNFDIPIMVGMKFGPARVNLGPVVSFKLSSEVKEASEELKEALDDYTTISNLTTIGGQVGVGLDILSKLTLDLRYEFGLSKLGDGITVDGTTIPTDQRQNQFIASVGYIF